MIPEVPTRPARSQSEMGQSVTAGRSRQETLEVRISVMPSGFREDRGHEIIGRGILLG